MAFESLTDRLAGVFKKLRGHGKLTEADIKAAMREVRMALLECCKKNLFLPRDECKHSHYVNLPTDRLICFLRYESDKSFFPDEPNSNCLNRKLLFPNWNLYEQPNDNYLNWCVRLHCVLHRSCC